MKTAAAAKAAEKPELTDEALKKMILRQQRAIAAGKKGYKLSDELTDLLLEHMKDGRVVPLGNGRAARMKDRYADTNKVGYGGAVRRFEVEVKDAEDVKL
jgi:hypothetical protein